MSKKSIFGHFNSPTLDFLDILIDFWGIFPGGLKWHFSDFKMHFWGFGVSGLCREDWVFARCEVKWGRFVIFPVLRLLAYGDTALKA